ncbi:MULTISPECIES: D-alanine--D-alanine ligase family protein [Clostridium]|mgnify:CR=1 FL=1|jgi:D-alanine-D-alanine ligase|uniref:D-alanine--D-alanine ligase n=2 Tax=Clostridium TaxID=1485 RepID=A0A151AP54_9CLOT|nr:MULTISPECIES: D-alanine--D-alanine ligase family protein [Clostridium]KYH29408.1 D-alanine--D-alanine ligase [Clostridium colicanis DSM 13634]MBE6044056.1 D-alanine--D-alanine ligase [Clostridium thermopalmarium]PRR70810.1 D-alanine--D-alanine ligase [Clostridium thermopalmarium DSM 5974]PVZ28734.1 D-alanine-D-alanine ligase [Clostridium thermopalmarium DSM 5974]
MKKKVAILFGGQSTEHEVSRVSASSVLRNIDLSKYDVYPIGITKDGKWFEYTGAIDKIENGEWEKDEFYKSPNGQEILFNREVDVVFPVMHGLYGEDGTIQGLCKLLGIPCVGPGVMSSAVCMDKVYTKYLLENFGIKQANYVVVNAYEYRKNKESLLEEIENKLGYAVFIKPSNSGSSVGITKAHNREELEKGLEEALKFDRKILVEEAINAREVEVAVLGNDEPTAATPGEIIPANEFYDYEAKYSNAESKLLIPAALSQDKLEEIRQLAIKIYKILDCAGLARVDFLVDKETEEAYLNEVNTIPGFTKISMYPKMWQADGKSYGDLISELIELAIERNNL